MTRARRTSGHSGARRPGGFREGGVEVHLDASGDGPCRPRRDAHQEPRRTSRAPPPLIAARSRGGSPVVGELELAWRLLPNEFIAVTGTNGKTTTTEWIGHVHREAGGRWRWPATSAPPLSSLVGELDPDATVVCEASSFQLEDTERLRARGGGAAQPHARPPRPARRPTTTTSRRSCGSSPTRATTTSRSCPTTSARRSDLGGCARRVAFRREPGRRGRPLDGPVYLRWTQEPLLAPDEIALPGAHNVENAMAAAPRSRSRAASTATPSRAGLRSFAGVPHRLELVADVGRRRYVNDSKATNVDSALVGAALLSRAAST